MHTIFVESLYKKQNMQFEKLNEQSKAVVLRLVESGVITEEKAQRLLFVDADSVSMRIALTGRAELWQKDTRNVLRYGSLLENMAFNMEYELLSESREISDKAFLKKIKKEFADES